MVRGEPRTFDSGSMTTIRYSEIEGPLGRLRGIIHEPPPELQRGAAMIIHGFFSANKIGPARLYVQLARLLVKHGYVVWRFDCYGVGDSDGEFSQASYESEFHDYSSILPVFQQEHAGEYVLVGHSMGTSLAVLLAAGRRDIDRLLLLSPSFGQVTWPENLFSSEQLEELRTTGMTVRKGIEVNAGFVDAFQSETILPAIPTLSTKTTIFYGGADEFYSNESAQRAANALRADRFIVIPEADHNFLYGDSRKKLLVCVGEELQRWAEELP